MGMRRHVAPVTWRCMPLEMLLGNTRKKALDSYEVIKSEQVTDNVGLKIPETA